MLKNKIKINMVMSVVLLVSMTIIACNMDKVATVEMEKENKNVKTKNGKVVVIDPGHGGTDPGKVGIDGQLEKDINLAVAKKLKTYLEASDVKVVLTRDVDTGLYSSKDTHKKMADMKKRCQLIEEAKPDLVISIHQNSYHEEAIRGGQVFYYKTSVRGKKLAESLQKRFDYVLGDSNKRQAKANDNYYLLLHVKEPIVIAECGFLSNREEAKKLETEEYQERLAWTLHMGIMEYLNQNQ